MPLKLIFENCLRCGIFINTWKGANVVLSHKKIEKNHKENYRPISLLPIFAKILEKLIYEFLIKRLVVQRKVTQDGREFYARLSTSSNLKNLNSL